MENPIFTYCKRTDKKLSHSICTERKYFTFIALFPSSRVIQLWTRNQVHKWFFVRTQTHSSYTILVLFHSHWEPNLKLFPVLDRQKKTHTKLSPCTRRTNMDSSNPSGILSISDSFPAQLHTHSRPLPLFNTHNSPINSVLNTIELAH